MLNWSFSAILIFSNFLLLYVGIDYFYTGNLTLYLPPTYAFKMHSGAPHTILTRFSQQHLLSDPHAVHCPNDTVNETITQA